MTRPFRISGPWMPLSETESEPGVPFSDRGYGTPQEPGNLGKRRLFPIVIALPVLENHRLGLERREDKTCSFCLSVVTSQASARLELCTGGAFACAIF